MIIKLSERNLTAESTAPARQRRFGLIGAAGFIAPRHFRAIKETNSQLVAAVDPHDSVGELDNFFPNAKFFTEIERFDRFLERMRSEHPVEYISVCSPNYLHDAHVRLALRVKSHAICEKPLAINPWNLEQLKELEAEHGRRVFTVLQLRLHPAIQQLREALQRETNTSRRDIVLTYVTRRGPWYHSSWKGAEEKSGGLAMNIGVHFFDVLMWLFGSPQRSQVHVANAQKISGVLELDNARVRWFLSVDQSDLPDSAKQGGGHAYRSLTIDGQEIDFSTGFNDLHTELYRQTLAGNGFGIEDARPAVELVYAIRNSREVSTSGIGHPLLENAWS